MDRFTLCLPFTLAQECPFPNDWGNPRNFSNDAFDPGGETMCGIIQREYDAYRKHKGEPVRDVRHITQDEGEEIYQNQYWLPHCPDLYAGLDLCFFDAAVNEGSVAAIRLLQRVLGMPANGTWGPSTTFAARAITDPMAAIHLFAGRRETAYRSLRGFVHFGKDWLRRNKEITAEALKMVGQEMV